MSIMISEGGTELLTVTQAAARLDVSAARVYQHIRDNGLPAVKVGGVYLISREDLEEWEAGRIAERV